MSAERRVVIGSKAGLHARPASLIVKESARYSSELELVTPSKTVNLKSLISVMALGLTQGTEVTVKATGTDEAEASLAVASLLAANLDQEPV